MCASSYSPIESNKMAIFQLDGKKNDSKWLKFKKKSD